MLYSLARPMLFSLAPERAHELTLSMLDKAHKLGMMRQTVEAKSQLHVWESNFLIR